MAQSGKLKFDRFAVGDRGKSIFLLLFGLLLILFGLTLDTLPGIYRGLIKIIIEPDYLITDYMEVGGMGASFMNSGLLTLAFTAILIRMKIRLRGISFATIFIIAGFAFFGKNIFNVWFPVAGVWLFSLYRNEPFLQYVYIAFFGTALAPLVSQIMFGFNFPPSMRIVFGAFIGVGAGFILPPLASAFMGVHRGFNLYNTGFASGMVGTLAVSLFRSHGFIDASRVIWSRGNNLLLAPPCIFCFASFIAAGWWLNGKSFKGYGAIWKHPGRLVADFVDIMDFPPTLINMGINGLIALGYILLIGGDLNGPTLGGIFTISGFSALGKTPRNITPIILGVVLASLTKNWGITDPPIQLAALFGTTLAPIAGAFGWQYGVLAGYIHSSVVLNVGFLHGGFNLYNNGFAGGIVAALLVPLIEIFREGRRK
ncbi:MAG: DUF1576 domain-containing protein [Synergistaceae bacterium]|nr:DUF1576 domain-containing protein [Synergistaceae bacterium]